MKNTCTVAGCERPHYAHGWCLGHCRRAEKNDGNPTRLCRGPKCDVDLPIRRGRNMYCCDECRPRCSVGGCNRPSRSSEGRCGPCQKRYVRNMNADPLNAKCAACGSLIDLMEIDESGRRKPAHTRLCGKCRVVNGRVWQKFIPYLINRDGTGCSICGEQIDQDLDWPHPRSLTVDHVVPRSHGGSHEATNLRLAHMSCNRQRSNILETKALLTA